MTRDHIQLTLVSQNLQHREIKAFTVSSPQCLSRSTGILSTQILLLHNSWCYSTVPQCHHITTSILFTDTVESITPHKMKGVRTILNSSAMDILYYTSPLYRSEVSLKTSLRFDLDLSHDLCHFYVHPRLHFAATLSFVIIVLRTHSYIS